jgi:hypothetical protein
MSRFVRLDSVGKFGLQTPTGSTAHFSPKLSRKSFFL